MPSQKTATLAPVNVAVFHGGRYVVQQQTTAVVKEARSLSGDDFRVMDAQQQHELFRMDGKVMSLRDKKTLVDNVGRAVCCVKSDFSLRRSVSIYEGDDSGAQKADLTKKMALLKKKLEGSVTTADGRKQQVVVKGELVGRNFQIYVGEQLAATVSRKLQMKELLWSDKQCYYLTVAPGADLAFFVAIAVSIDEIFNDSD